LTNYLFIACAGAGKTTRIVKEAIQLTNEGKKVLVITYTRSNQNELLVKFSELGGIRNELFVVKGWYAFLLEDIIRPYQQSIFKERISGIFLNSSNPHIRKGRQVPGTGEKVNGTYNDKHFLNSKGQAHTEFISKLACRILKESKVNIGNRISAIYDRVYLDETQDFAGWDFELIKKLAKAKELEVHAVGDFRQTVYHTTSAPKKPASSAEKLDAYQKMGFQVSQLADCWRSTPEVCSLADTVHQGEGYAPTVSKVSIPTPKTHNGIFYVSSQDVDSYIKQHNPLILRYSSATGKDLDIHDNLMTFGDSKGLTCDNVLILPTEPMLKFLKGLKDPFAKSSTGTSKNKFYVAITRARYSVAFIVDDKHFVNSYWKTN